MTFHFTSKQGAFSNRYVSLMMKLWWETYHLSHLYDHWYHKADIPVWISFPLRSETSFEPYIFFNKTLIQYKCYVLSDYHHVNWITLLSLELWSTRSHYKPNEYPRMATVVWSSYYMHYVITSILNYEMFLISSNDMSYYDWCSQMDFFLSGAETQALAHNRDRWGTLVQCSIKQRPYRVTGSVSK